MVNDSPSYFELFDTAILLERELLLLLQKEDRWFSTEEISEALDIKNNTTLRIIKRLEGDILELSENSLEIQISKGKGVRLVKDIDEDIKKFLGIIFSQTPIMQMIVSIFNGEFGTVKKYAQNNFISEATVRRHLIKIRKFLEPYHIQIARETAEVKGKESQIRMFLNLMYWRLYAGTDWPFQGIEQHAVYNIVNRFLDKINSTHSISEIYRERIAYYVSITLMRTRKGNFVQFQPEWDIYIDENESYQEFEEIMKEFRGDINTKYPEIPFHYVVWTSFFSAYTLSKFVPQFIESQIKKKSVLYQTTRLMLTEFEKVFFHIPRDNYELLESYVYSTHSFCYNFWNFSTEIVPLGLSKKVPILERKLAHFIDYLYEISGNPIFLERKQLTYRYFLFFSHIENVMKYEQKIYLILESDLPILLKKNMMNSITHYLGTQFNLSFVTDNQAVFSQPVDIVLTTNASTTVDKKYSNTKIVNIDRNLSIHDIHRVSEVCQEIIEQKSGHTANTNVLVI
ncbi:helix-turn-helix domain-containing protein [Enterococcus villorum]|uniref:Mga helix-turn-helix domain-containing protein n=2 Tax=Enterococcus villorum TaxID=112904 RepID=A0A511J3C2_9ENTE|nr:helix-turn-helix domain-containing protein [Enterococcus villorum]EOH91996.1 hypothetical protein UAO_00667 [Enterococcus villorum ATCC 700913]EOW76712.1 hypothetical protein I591_02020 [Enterococcus villorum ATCC 700913]GEL92518.1 hypothetical protein EVI01_18550 [Enterococcus villorum]